MSNIYKHFLKCEFDIINSRFNKFWYELVILVRYGDEVTIVKSFGQFRTEEEANQFLNHISKPQ